MEVFLMKFNYNRLWKMLIDRNMNKTDLKDYVGLSTTTVAKLSKNETVNMNILARICEYFNCEIEDIITI
jgi:hypothetical protein